MLLAGDPGAALCAAPLMLCAMQHGARHVEPAPTCGTPVLKGSVWCAQLRVKIQKQQAIREQKARRKNLTKYIPNAAAAIYTVRPSHYWVLWTIYVHSPHPAGFLLLCCETNRVPTISVRAEVPLGHGAP